jgi:hypothetical protein
MPKASTLLLVLTLLFWSTANLLAETPTAAALQGTSPGSDEELVKQLSNPVSSLVNVPFQNNFDFGLGTGDGQPTDTGWGVANQPAGRRSVLSG